MSFCKAIIAGNVVSDVTYTETKNGAMASFRVETKSIYNNNTASSYHCVTAWGPVIESTIRKLIRKDTHVYIEGKLRNRKYTKDNVVRFYSDIRIDRIHVFETVENDEFYINNIMLIGNVANDKYFTEAQTGKIMRFQVATDEKYKIKNDISKNTYFHNITCWDQLVDDLKDRIHKGCKVYIEGNLRYYKTIKEGVAIIRTEIRANKIVLLKYALGNEHNNTESENIDIDNFTISEQDFDQNNIVP